MIASLPKSVFYLDDLGTIFGEIDVPRQSVTLRVFRTKEEAGLAKDVLKTFFGVQTVIEADKLSEVLKTARTADDPIRVVLCEYDALGELIEAEVLLDPYAHAN